MGKQTTGVFPSLHEAGSYGEIQKVMSQSTRKLKINTCLASESYHELCCSTIYILWDIMIWLLRMSVEHHPASFLLNKLKCFGMYWLSILWSPFVIKPGELRTTKRKRQIQWIFQINKVNSSNIIDSEFDSDISINTGNLLRNELSPHNNGSVGKSWMDACRVATVLPLMITWTWSDVLSERDGCNKNHGSLDDIIHGPTTVSIRISTHWQLTSYWIPFKIHESWIMNPWLWCKYMHK